MVIRIYVTFQDIRMNLTFVVTVGFIFEKTAKPIAYTSTFGSTVVIRIYVTFQDIRMDLTLVFRCLYCNEILTIKGNTHRDSGLPNSYCPVDFVCSH